MTERPRVELLEQYRITAVAPGAAIGIVTVLHALGMGLGEIALVFGPMLVFLAPLLGYHLWTHRRGAS